jgi:hypothetical protein
VEATDKDAAAPAPSEPEKAPEAAPKDAEAPHLLHGIASFLARRKAGPRVLVVTALAIAGLAAVCFVLDHPGLAGVLGLIALLLGEISLAPSEPVPDSPPRPFVSGLNVLTDMVLAGAVATAAMGRNAGAEFLLGLVVMGLFAWLPYLDSLQPVPAPRAGTTLWRRFERVGILLLGAVLGHPFLGPLLVAAVGVIDAWLAMDRLARLPGTTMTDAEKPEPKPIPAFLGALLRPDGSLQPLVRWGSLVIAVLLMLVLPRAGSWRF